MPQGFFYHTQKHFKKNSRRALTNSAEHDIIRIDVFGQNRINGFGQRQLLCWDSHDLPRLAKNDFSRKALVEAYVEALSLGLNQCNKSSVFEGDFFTI